MEYLKAEKTSIEEKQVLLTKQSNQNYYMNFRSLITDNKSSDFRKEIFNFFNYIKHEQFFPEDLFCTIIENQEIFEQQFLEIWKDEEPEFILNIGECIEKFICSTLYDKLMNVYAVDLDYKIGELFWIYDFIEPKHLGFNDQLVQVEVIELASKEIKNLSRFKSPKDKLICISNFCKIVNSIISETYEQSPQLDNFISIFAYIFIKVKPNNIKRNLRFIRDYRHPIRFSNSNPFENDSFTLIEKIIAFIENIESKDIKMDPSEFAKSILVKKQKYDAFQESLQHTPYMDCKIELAVFTSKIENQKKLPSTNNWRTINKSTMEEIMIKLSELKALQLIDGKKQKLYGKETLTIQDLNELLSNYQFLSDKHGDLCNKLRQIYICIQDKYVNPKRGERNTIWKLFSC